MAVFAWTILCEMVDRYAWHYYSRDQQIKNENPSRNSFLDPLGIGNTLPQLLTFFTVCTPLVDVAVRMVLEVTIAIKYNRTF